MAVIADGKTCFGGLSVALNKLAQSFRVTVKRVTTVMKEPLIIPNCVDWNSHLREETWF